MTRPVDQFEPGARVTVTQQIPQRHEVWTTQVTGTVQGYEQRKTGSWFAHSKDDKLWLDRLILRKDDGEIVICVLDNYTRVELLAPPTIQQDDQQADDSDDDGANAGEPETQVNGAA